MLRSERDGDESEHAEDADGDKEADEERITLRPLASALPRVLVDGRRRW